MMKDEDKVTCTLSRFHFACGYVNELSKVMLISCSKDLKVPEHIESFFSAIILIVIVVDHLFEYTAYSLSVQEQCPLCRLLSNREKKTIHHIKQALKIVRNISKSI